MLSIPDLASFGPFMMSNTVNSWIQSQNHLLLLINNRVDLYKSGDWGNLSEEDWQANIDTIKSSEPGGTILGAYELPNNQRLWIITSGYGNQKLGADYCYTNIMSPEDF